MALNNPSLERLEGESPRRYRQPIASKPEDSNVRQPGSGVNTTRSVLIWEKETELENPVGGIVGTKSLSIEPVKLVNG